MNAIFQLLNPANTVTVNRPLAHAVGLAEAIIYGALISKFYYYSERGMLDNGWFYSTAPDLAESTTLSERQQKRAIDNLVAVGLLRSELRGMPAKRCFRIVEDISLLQRLISEGEAKIREIKPAAAERYEKKRQSSENSEPKPETQSLINFLSAGFGEAMPENEPSVENIDENTSENTREAALYHCSDKSAEQAPTKTRSKLRQNVGASFDETSEQLFIKSKDNNPKIINQSITRAREEKSENEMIDRIDGIKCREEYLELLKENISYDYLCEQHKDDKSRIDELLSIMLEVICSTKPTVRANGGDVPQEVVKSVFLKLDKRHIDYVLTALKKNTSEVRNIRAYLITALYNAPQTIENHKAANTNRELQNQPAKETTNSSFDMDDVMTQIKNRYQKTKG